MKITFVTESHTFSDDKQTEDVARQEDLDELRAKIQTLIQAGEKSIADIGKRVETNAAEIQQNGYRIQSHTDWIRGVESRVDVLPQTLREALERAWKETFADRLAMGEKVFESLRQESERMATELVDLRRQRDEMKVEMENLRTACDEMKNMYETRLKTLGDRLSDAWQSAFEKTLAT